MLQNSGSPPREATIRATAKVSPAHVKVVDISAKQAQAHFGDEERKSLSVALRWIIGALWFVSVMVVAILFLAGFKAWGFRLDVAVLIALVGGISLQYVVSAVFPLSRAIADIARESMRQRKNA